ncbi:uncharacterized protein LOC127809893 isoform X2 [Diospyros lotus]|uniref:uncharacterized protein LOC127809893 isoform X2 n=1 Tax=Diospyros lotus TaxID=55363 RepID=UPI0022594252|nr:uncharacterized protein LOC127809893 isoform X2 [Diospyros lotus]
MSAIAIFTPSGPNNLFKKRRNPLFFFDDRFLLGSRCSSALSHVFLRFPRRTHKQRPSISISAPRFKPFCPVMEWQDCTVKMEMDLPTSVAYNCYSNREAIPRWMPFISSVKILEDKPDLSRWSLKYKAFGRDIEYSWLARNMQPIPNQKIHWRSLEGLPNRHCNLFLRTYSYVASKGLQSSQKATPRTEQGKMQRSFI